MKEKISAEIPVTRIGLEIYIAEMKELIKPKQKELSKYINLLEQAQSRYAAIPKSK